ncbi:MAG: thiol-disulfide isomerase/thioredoxin, partial [Yoonia sp.]
GARPCDVLACQSLIEPDGGIDCFHNGVRSSGKTATPHRIRGFGHEKGSPVLKLKSALLYTALGLLANTALADVSTFEALREGDMRKLNFHSDPRPASNQPFTGEDGNEMTLAAYEGQITVVNFWATWCAPCRAEMPHLSDLQTQLGSDDLSVVTIATGRNPRPAMERFFEEISVDNLPLHADPRSTLARNMGVLGLPITVILDRDGQEIARLQGDADWSSESAIAILTALRDVE